MDTVTGLPMAILPPKFAELPLKVVLLIVNPATLLMPPPYRLSRVAADRAVAKRSGPLGVRDIKDRPGIVFR